jgi:hypothetical protein
MKSEMDLLHMDERQRLAWLMANRGTVMAVGATWIGMIVWELVQGRAPVFLIAMVPVFALVRVGLFFHYCSRPFVEESPRRDFTRVAKIGAAVLLGLSVFLPLYRMERWAGDDTVYGYAWRMALDDPATILPLAFAYFWPILTLMLGRGTTRGSISMLNQVAEPLLAAASTVLILWIPQFIFELRPFFVVLTVPVGARPEWGCYLAVVANGIYFVAWLAGYLRPSGVHPTEGDA